MKEQLTTFKVAELARKKGFDEKVRYVYDIASGTLEDERRPGYYNEDEFVTSAPTQASVQRWLREVCGIKVTVDTDVTLSWIYSIQSLYPEASYSGDYIVSENIFSTYEEALKEGLLEALKLINND